LPLRRKEFLAKRVNELESEREGLVNENERLKREAAEMAADSSQEKMHDLQFELQEAMNKVETLARDGEEERERVQDLEAKVAAAEREVAASKEEVDKLQRRVQQVESEKEVLQTNSKADVKTLAREVKRVQREQQQDQMGRAKQEREVVRLQGLLSEREAGDEADTASTLKVLREAEVLHTRMQECNIDKLMMEESGSGNGVEGGAGKDFGKVDEIYQLSDNRISCLLAEVQFLTEADAAQESKLGKRRQESNQKLRQTLADILIEHAHLHRACNRLIRDAKGQREGGQPLGLDDAAVGGFGLAQQPSSDAPLGPTAEQAGGGDLISLI